MFSGADPHKENFEPLFFREEECCDEEGEDEDEGYIPGTTPLNMAATTQVRRLPSAPGLSVLVRWLTNRPEAAVLVL